MAQLPRHDGCLQIDRRRPSEMCGLRTRPRTDGDPSRFLPPSNCHRRGGAYRLAPLLPGAIPCIRQFQHHRSAIKFHFLARPADARAVYSAAVSFFLYTFYRFLSDQLSQNCRQIFRVVTIRCDTRCYFNMRSKADMSQLLSLIYRTENTGAVAVDDQSEISFSISHIATPDTTKLSCLCRVRFGGVNWIPDDIRLAPIENVKSVNTFRAIVQFTPAHQTRYRQDCLDLSGGWWESGITQRGHSSVGKKVTVAHTRLPSV